MLDLVILLVSWFAAISIVSQRLERHFDSFERPKFQRLVSAVIVVGLVGARLGFILYNLEYYRSDPLAILKIWQGGLVYTAGLAAAALGLWPLARIYGFTFGRAFDGVSLAATLAQGFISLLSLMLVSEGPFSWVTLFIALGLNLALPFCLLWNIHRARFEGQVGLVTVIAGWIVPFLIFFGMRSL